MIKKLLNTKTLSGMAGVVIVALGTILAIDSEKISTLKQQVQACIEQLDEPIRDFVGDISNERHADSVDGDEIENELFEALPNDGNHGDPDIHGVRRSDNNSIQ